MCPMSGISCYLICSSRKRKRSSNRVGKENRKIIYVTVQLAVPRIFSLFYLYYHEAHMQVLNKGYLSCLPAIQRELFKTVLRVRLCRGLCLFCLRHRG